MNGFDAVLLSYDEPMATSLHSRLQRTLGGKVKRLHGVHGMRRAYRLCAEVVDHEQFFLADGDFAIDATSPPPRWSRWTRACRCGYGGRSTRSTV